MDVITHPQEVVSFFNRDRFVSSLKQMTAELVPTVELKASMQKLTSKVLESPHASTARVSSP
jgi:hypothetical protein